MYVNYFSMKQENNINQKYNKKFSRMMLRYIFSECPLSLYCTVRLLTCDCMALGTSYF